MNELNEKILKNFKNSVSISNMKEEISMKKSFTKQVVTFSLLTVVFLSGGLFTVDAATGGEITKSIKENIQENIINKMNTDTFHVKEDSIVIDNYEVDENNNITDAKVTFEAEGNNDSIYTIQYKK